MQEDATNQKIHEHKMVYVNKVQEMMNQGSSSASQVLKRGAQYADICENIVTQIFQVPMADLADFDRVKKFEELLGT